MSVTDHPVDPQSEVPSHDRPGLDPQAALELAHELVLVTRATFAQLLPETADRAISGVPDLQRQADVPQQSAVPTTSQTLPMPAAASPVPSVPAALPASAALPPVAVPSIDLPPAADTPGTLEESAPVTPTAPLAVPIVVASVEPIHPDPSPSDGESFVPPIALSLSSIPAAGESPVDYIPVPGVESPPVPPLLEAPPAPEVPDVAEVPTTQVAPVPHRPQHLSLAMLEEIGFLDE
jgi:hypothetical protein